jgi:uncharacterized delta-60 repeat protein
MWAVPALGPLERGNFADALAMLIHHPIRRLATSLALAVLALLGLACAWAQVARADRAGALDASFSADGRVATDLFGGGRDVARAVAIQPDGKIVVAGDWRFGTIGANFALARYNPDGSLDPEFGSAGRVLTDFDAEADFAEAVAIQPDGKIVVAGEVRVGGRTPDFGLVRYNPDGRLDTSFAGDGKQITSFGGSDGASAVLLQAGGRIVAVGTRNDDDGVADGDFALARYEPNGALDTSFSGDGKQITSFGKDEVARGAALERGGKIVVAGYHNDDGDGDYDFALARYDLDGSLDRSFDDDGKVETGLGGYDKANAVAIQPDGKIVAAGHTLHDDDREFDFALARYHRDGSLDRGFAGGTEAYDFAGSDFANAVAVQADGKIVAAGDAHTLGNARCGRFALARVNPDGYLDRGFSANGRTVTAFGGCAGAEAVAVQRDGRIVAAGYSFFGGRYFSDVLDLVLARYLAVSTPYPNSVIDSGPTVVTTDPTPTFAFSSTERRTTFQCSLDGAAFAPCSSPHTTVPLADGSHTFRVRAVSSAGVVDPTPAERRFTVDRDPVPQ